MYRLLLVLLIVSLTQLSCSDEQYARLLMEVDKANTRLYELQRHQTSRFSPENTTKAYEQLALAKQMARLSQFEKAELHLNKFHQFSQQAIQQSQFQTISNSTVVLTALDQSDHMVVTVKAPIKEDPPVLAKLPVEESPPIIVSSSTALEVSTPAQVAQPIPKASKPSYIIVRSGDWLMKIARQLSQYSVTWSDIFMENSDIIRNPNRIYPGQKLFIP